jgi:hypothetical protein
MYLSYSVYGLCLNSNLPIPGLTALPSTTEFDVEVWGQLMPPIRNELLEASPEIWYASPYLDERGEPVLMAWKLGGGEYFRLRYSDGAEFLLDRRGTQIWFTWPDTLTIEDMAVYLLGPVLGLVLRLRGTVCLHASAICVGEKAIALVGAAGSGKSTTAAAFARMGYPVLSDDIVALSDQNGTYWVQPAYPYLRLWPASVEILYGAPDVLPRLVPGDTSWDKCYLNLVDNDHEFQPQPLPLAAAYVLGDRREDLSAPFAESLSSGAGLMSLVANSYANYLLDRNMRSQEFEFLSRVVANVALRRVVPHLDPAYLSKLCNLILDDFQLSSGSASMLTVDCAE